ncbi:MULTISPECIES: hypothetical protein [Streptomyces]|uniref:hypothetical protein n=1 Tax=Streptomyces TaxID=1883 RepID=UPI00292D866D|nr:hypothetical protein [Streptomyces sp. NEAU-HV9]
MHDSDQLARHRIAEFHAQADAHRLATEAHRPNELRVRLGWTLVEVGLRLASAPRPALA